MATEPASRHVVGAMRCIAHAGRRTFGCDESVGCRRGCRANVMCRMPAHQHTSIARTGVKWIAIRSGARSIAAPDQENRDVDAAYDARGETACQDSLDTRLAVGTHRDHARSCLLHRRDHLIDGIAAA